MSNLPSEILHNIFIRVPLQQRLECMRVCRCWYNSLSKRSLFYDVEIQSEWRLSQFINMLLRLPSRSSQVEILKVETSSTFDKRVLCNILPNLRVFEFTERSYNDEKKSHCSIPFEPDYLNSKLESITDGAKNEVTRQLLEFHSCSRLRSLKLDIEDIENPREDIFIHLKNAPYLKELYLGYSNIGITDCEIIHKNTPVLETLNLDEVTLLPGKLPRNITPATSVTSFSMDVNDAEDNHDYPDFYKYIAMKYPNLTSFNYQDQEMENINSSEVLKIYRDGIFPIYKNIGRHLNYFKACNIPTELNAFNMLDDLGLKISNFNIEYNGERPIFDQLAESNQSNYAKSIILEDTVIASPIILLNFTSLTTIKIDSNDLDMWTVDLTDFFNVFPATLTSFSADFAKANISELPTRTNNIESFSLRCNIFYAKLAESISNYFPKLNELVLSGLITENLNLNLPNNHFNDLTIEAHHEGVDLIGFSVTDANNPQGQCYIQDPDSSYPFSLRFVAADELQDRTIISLNYTTTDNLHLFALHFNSEMEEE